MKWEAVTVFLNRSCPRGCPQCGISDGSRRPLPIDVWKEALRILREYLGVRFFLFLGTEPLLLGDGLVELVKWFNEQELFYGFYSTSPEPLFTRYREALVDAGLRNWSSGIDYFPGQAPDEVTNRKVEDSLAGLCWMNERGVQVHTLTTVHQRNLDNTAQLMRYCQDLLPGATSSLNFIEWSRGESFDFFSSLSVLVKNGLSWTGSDSEKKRIQRMLDQVEILSREKGRRIQCPTSFYKAAVYHYDKLNVHCHGIVGPAVDCDGTMRLCGYSKGTKDLRRISVFDLPRMKAQFLERYCRDLGLCHGCHWIFTEILNEDRRLLDPNGGFYEERWNE